MSNMYEIILDLCAAYGIKPGRVCADTGLSRGIMSDLKMGRTRELSAKNIRIIATYFGVSVDYLLGRGPKIDPLNPTRRIFQVMNEKKMTLKELSAAIEMPVDTIRAFALGDDVVVEDPLECLERIAIVLKATHSYLMGWSNVPEDDEPYNSITEKMWLDSGLDPERAHGMQEAIGPEIEERQWEQAEKQDQAKEQEQEQAEESSRTGRTEIGINDILSQLNSEGIERLIGLARDLAEIPKYRKGPWVPLPDGIPAAPVVSYTDKEKDIKKAPGSAAKSN